MMMFRFGRLIATSMMLCAALSVAGVRAEVRSQCPDVQTSIPRGRPASKVRAQVAANLASDTPLLVFGDSIAARWPDGDLKSVFGVAPVKLAVGGDRLEHTNWIVGQVRPGVRPRAIVIVSGTNNVNHDSDCEFDSRVEALMTSVREKFPDAKIYEMNITPKGVGRRAFLNKVRAANQYIQQAAARHNITFFDGYTALETACEAEPGQDCPLYEPDRLHPNPKGFEPLTAALASVAKRHVK